jgi:hypothetical protein
MHPSLSAQRSSLCRSLSAQWLQALLSAHDGDELFSQSATSSSLAITSSLRTRKGEGRKMPNWDRGIKKRRSGIRKEKVNLGSRCLLSDSQIIAIRYRSSVSEIRKCLLSNSHIALQYRNNSRDSINLRYTGTICTALLMTCIVSYDMYRVSYDTNFYAW